MRSFLKTLLASFVALVLFAGLALLLVIGLASAMGSGEPKVPAKAVLVFDLNTSIPDSAHEASPADALSRGLSGQGGDGTPLPLLVQALDRAAEDKAISALFLTGNVESAGFSSGPAALKELREAIARFRQKSGKPVIAYNLGWSKNDYYLCSGASALYVNPAGSFDVTGLSSQPMFYAGLFKKYGVEMQVTRVGKYKSAVEPFLLEKMSDANREQTLKFLGDLWDVWKTAVAADRKQAPEALQALADTKGVLLPEEAVKAGLVDRAVPYDEVLDELKKLSGKQPKDKEFPQIDLETYAKIPVTQKGSNRIAVVYAEGEIVDGEGQSSQVGGERVSAELRRLRLDAKVKAVVLRVNSPGGSASASDLIQREVILTRKVKPVVVSMGHLAASGGYWISTYGDRIFAEPNTITGSIGVFGMFPNVQKLANAHGITWDAVQTAKLAFPSISRPQTPEELARLQRLVDDVYEQFLTKVAEGRKMKRDAVHEIAQGRVWSGREAQKLGLVDEMGGLQEAIRHAAKMAKVEGDYRVDAPEPAKAPIEKLMKLLGGGEKRKLARKDPASQIRQELDRAMASLQALNDPRGIYARMPLEVVIR
jgi:protease-4